MKFNLFTIEVIRNLLDKYNNDCQSVHYVDLMPYVPKGSNPKDVVMLPNVIAWDPLKKSIDILYCPHCYQDHNVRNKVSSSTWHISKKRPPRFLWDRGWHCALVGKTYLCNKGHSIVSYHFGILNQLPENTIPFMLTHLTGITVECYDLVIKLIEHGNSVQGIEEILKGMYVDTYERKRLRYPANSTPDLEVSMLAVPTEYALVKYFETQYDTNKDLYQAQMDEIPFSQLHVVTNKNKFDVNIGYRERFGAKNCKWTKQFDHMFLVFNEAGCVKAYGLTKGVCIEQVIQCLVALAPFNPGTETISMSGYCCEARDSLQESFPNSTITFGLDCAKDLLKQHIDCSNVKHAIYKDLDAAFKTNSSNQTASEHQLLYQLNELFSKWSVSTDVVLKDSFLDELEILKLHIRNGCLTPPILESTGAGKKKIFDFLDKIFYPPSLGVPIACSMIAQMVYVHNCDRLGKSNHRPIWVHREAETINKNTEIAGASDWSDELGHAILSIDSEKQLIETSIVESFELEINNDSGNIETIPPINDGFSGLGKSGYSNLSFFIFSWNTLKFKMQIKVTKCPTVPSKFFNFH